MFLKHLNGSKNSNITHLTESNIETYVKDEYGSNAFPTNGNVVENFTPLLQNDYGGRNDCTLTCITSVVNHITDYKYRVDVIYNNVENVAKKYFYNSNLGTSYITIKTIFDKSLNYYCSKNSKVGYLKNVGYKLNTILSQIDKGNPVILSMSSDGLGYYKKHSVVAIGYRTYSVNGQRKVFLKIYDNWSKKISYLDYDKISPVSVLHYLA